MIVSKPCRAVFLGIAILSLLNAPAYAWGPKTHAYIAARVVEYCPRPELKGFLERNKNQLLERIMDPDNRRSSDGMEKPCHFFTVEKYEPTSLWQFGLEEAEARVGRKFIQANGIAVWSIEASVFGLKHSRSAPGTARSDAARLNSLVDMIHYLSDLHQPFHCVEDWDGVRAGKPGLHRGYELDLVEPMIQTMRGSRSPAVIPIGELRSTLVEWAKTSAGRAEAITDCIDRTGATVIPGRETELRGITEAIIEQTINHCLAVLVYAEQEKVK